MVDKLMKIRIIMEKKRPMKIPPILRFLCPLRRVFIIATFLMGLRDNGGRVSLIVFRNI